MNEFKNNLKELETELSTYHRSKNELDVIYLDERLENSLKAYNAELENSLNYLRDKNEKNLLRRISPNNEQ